MPRARPSHRFTTGGQHRTSVQHRTTHVQHRTTRSHGATKAHKRTTHARHGKPTKRHEAAKPSARTIRMCHRLTYEKIMRSSSCRELMSQELKAASNRHHRATHRKSAAHHHKMTKAKTRGRHSKRHRS